MNAVRQKCRPKHQVLVLKCYPRYQKNATEVKPNSSELSYLLYYASTRRSKLQKVCDFLDKRTTSDVWKKRTGNVQVTLQILRSLIDKCPRDLPLFRGAMLRCLRTILKSNDLTLVEDSVATFEAFCANQDPATLAADQDYIKQYEEIVTLYAGFASKNVRESKTPINWPHAIRYRKAGLRAIKSLASSDSLNSETGRQLSVIIPAILLNIYSEDGRLLERLEQRDEEKEGFEKEMAFKRRLSVSTVRTAETVEPDPVAASGTIEDADKIAEEEVEIVALQGLRHIFSAVNRSQLRAATSTVLKFIIGRPTPSGANTIDEARWPHAESWATTLAKMLCSWAPVQDRYVILVATVESLARIPGAESDLNKQLVLAEIIQSLLRSGISFIGLSVMDVLIRLVQHILMLLQISTPATNPAATEQPTDVVISEKGAVIAPGQPVQPLASNPVTVEVTAEPSGTRRLLLARLQKSIGSLATHIYYSDQIYDMLSAVLSRLKPSPQAGAASAVAAIEDPEKAVDAVASSASLQEKHGANGFFSFETARLTALAAVKDILIMANGKSSGGPSNSIGRLRVGAKVWEGTQWLLRDPSEQVRRAYADAVLTWLQLETQKTDLRVTDERAGLKKERLDTLARRAVSSASNRERPSKRIRSTFLQLLHLAIYEDAHQFAESEEEFVMLHLLLTTLVQRLGVNSLRSGLPMVMRLQEDIQTAESPTAKVRFGSLVHGYLWAIETYFDFDTSSVGAAINTEIIRRREKGLWMKSIQMPPVTLSQIPAVVAGVSSSPIPAQVLERESLRPFDNRQALVDRIAEGYSSSLFSPQSSPPSSPGRTLSVPMLTTTLASRQSPAEELPSKVVEQLMANWSKDICIALTTRDTGSSASISGSRTGTGNASGNRGGLLAVNIPAASISDIEVPSPAPHKEYHHKEHHREHHISSIYGLVGGPHSGIVASRRTSASPTPHGTSSVKSALRVEDLKRALSGSKPVSFPVNEPQSDEQQQDDASASESMVSVDASVSEASFLTADNETPIGRNSRDGPARPHSAGSGSPRLGSPDEEDADEIPPVPPLPDSIRGTGSAGGSPSLALHIVSPSARTSVLTQDQRRPATAPAKESTNGAAISPTGLGGPTKSRSLKRGSGSVRQSTGLNRAASVTGNASATKPYFSGLLSKINVSEDDLDGEHGVADTAIPY